ncbi:MAG: hypothetical protein WD847_08490 [Pirellulales bacterium]
MVGKLDLLTDGLSIELTDKQRDDLASHLSGLEAMDELASADAERRIKLIRVELTPEQRSAVEAIELPRRRGGGGGGGGMGGGGGGGGGGGPGGGGGGPGGGGGAGGNTNPFKEEATAKKLENLRRKLVAGE